MNTILAITDGGGGALPPPEEMHKSVLDVYLIIYQNTSTELHFY